MKKIELESCPFCDGQAEIEVPPFRHFKFYRVVCQKCHCGTKEYPNIEMAVDDWNRRPEALVYKGHYRCPSCNTYNEVWKHRENTVDSDTVYCWHCGTKVKIEEKYGR